MTPAKRVYLDYNATAPIHPSVREELISSLDIHGNPSSVHEYGREAKRRVDSARENVASLIGAPLDSVVFTGGGAYNKGACNELAVRLGLSGQVGNPLLGIKDINMASLPRETAEAEGNQAKPGMPRSPDWAVALGLSVGASVETAA